MSELAQILFSILFILFLIGVTVFFYWNEKKISKDLPKTTIRKQYREAILIGIIIMGLGTILILLTLYSTTDSYPGWICLSAGLLVTFTSLISYYRAMRKQT